MERETRYARSDEYHIAYQVVGEGSRDLVLVPRHFVRGALLGGAAGRRFLTG